MRVNDWALINFSNGDGTMEGRLQHKKLGTNIAQGFKERWFKLKNNILFYFNLNEMGQVIDSKPAGALVVEHCTASYEMACDAEFAFSLTFHDDLDRKHVFSGRSEEKVNQWVVALKEASYEFWRAQLLILQMQLSSLTGQDPLLMYHRNEGSRLPLPPKDALKLELSSKVKIPKKTSFQSFVGTARPDHRPTAPSILSGLVFHDNHFGNGLEAIGSQVQQKGGVSPLELSAVASAITQVEQTMQVPARILSGPSTQGAVETKSVPTAKNAEHRGVVGARPFSTKTQSDVSFPTENLTSIWAPSNSDRATPVLVPTRVAPPPPPARPPRSARQPTTNLIDL